MIRRSLQIIIVLSVVMAGCSDEPNEQSKLPATRPADNEITSVSEEASSAQTSEEDPVLPSKVEYKTMPSSLAEAPKMHQTSFWMLQRMRNAIGSSDLESAIKLHRHIIESPASNQNVGPKATILLLKAMLKENAEGKDIYEDLKDQMQSYFNESQDIHPEMVKDWQGFLLCDHLAQLKSINNDSESVFTQWSAQYQAMLQQDTSIIYDRELFENIFKQLLEKLFEKGGSLGAECMNQVLVDLQTIPSCLDSNILWLCQKYRVYSMIQAGRNAEAVFATRVLLALSTKSAAKLLDTISVVKYLAEKGVIDTQSANQWLQYQYYGSAGPDSRVDTEDDITYPFVEYDKANAYLLKKATSYLDGNETLEDRHRTAYLSLLVGCGEEVFTNMNSILNAGNAISNVSADATYEILSYAQSYIDGHILNSISAAIMAARKEELNPNLRLGAIQACEERYALIQEMHELGNKEWAFGISAFSANQWEWPAFSERIMHLTFGVCRSSDSDQGWEQYINWGRRLTNCPSRLFHCRMVADHYFRAGGVEKVSDILSEFSATCPELDDDPEIVLLYTGSMIRQGEIDKALEIVKPLAERNDVKRDYLGQANLLLAAIYLTQGDKPRAREVLEGVLSEHENKYSSRARKILKQM